jgi:hypothetical protein
MPPLALYHFTSPDRVGKIKREGLTLGLVILPPPHAPPHYRLGDPLAPLPGQPEGTIALRAHVGQWLTDDPDWRQAWATRARLKLDRTAWRVRVDVPPGATALVGWPEFVRRQGLAERWPAWLADFEGQTLDLEGGAYGRVPDPARWWLYLGRVSPGWLRDWTRRPAAVPAHAEP